MPLNTQILRNGKLRVVPWDQHTLDCFLTVGLMEGDPETWQKFTKDVPEEDFTREWHGKEIELPMSFMMVPVYYLDTKAPLWTKGRHVVEKSHRFGIEDGFLRFNKNDILEMWRSHK